jgi:hypothetical protein
MKKCPPPSADGAPAPAVTRIVSNVSRHARRSVRLLRMAKPLPHRLLRPRFQRFALCWNSLGPVGGPNVPRFVLPRPSNQWPTATACAPNAGGELIKRVTSCTVSVAPTSANAGMRPLHYLRRRRRPEHPQRAPDTPLKAAVTERWSCWTA